MQSAQGRWLHGQPWHSLGRHDRENTNTCEGHQLVCIPENRQTCRVGNAGIAPHWDVYLLLRLRSVHRYITSSTRVSVPLRMFYEYTKSPSRTGLHPRLGLCHVSWAHSRISVNASGPFKLRSFSLVPYGWHTASSQRRCSSFKPTKGCKLTLRTEEEFLGGVRGENGGLPTPPSGSSLLWGCISHACSCLSLHLPAVTTGRRFGVLHIMFCICSLHMLHFVLVYVI